MLPSSFYGASVNPDTIINKTTTKKRERETVWGGVGCENYRPISLMNRDVKIPDNILANWIQEHIKRIILHD